MHPRLRPLEGLVCGDRFEAMSAGAELPRRDHRLRRDCLRRRQRDVSCLPRCQGTACTGRSATPHGLRVARRSVSGSSGRCGRDPGPHPNGAPRREPKMTDVSIGPAQRYELPQVLKLLEEGGLPPDGLEEHPAVGSREVGSPRHRAGPPPERIRRATISRARCR